MEVSSKLPKVSLVNASLKKLKFYLTQFDSIMKKRTTPNALKEVQTVFDQMDAAVQQSSVDKQCLEIAKKEILLENDQLLHKIMSQQDTIKSLKKNTKEKNVHHEKCDIDTHVGNEELENSGVQKLAFRKRAGGLFLKTKDEAPAAIIKCIKNIQVRLKATVRNVRTDNGTEFINQTLREWYENVVISHQTSVARTPQQNGIVKRRNRTLVEAARTMLIFSKALLFLWAEALNTACYTQNRSLIRL
ncbi:retrovirus-related pol polyprotein from transposon TNT 1-94 [Tanacetum coccineum]